MKLKAIIATIIAITSACTTQQSEKNLTIDLNGTFHATLRAYALPDTTTAIDSAYLCEGVYRFSTASWPYGCYRLIIDSCNYIDIVAQAETPINICARVNHLNEATTDDRETELLWNIERLQIQADTMAVSDSLRMATRLRADKLRTQAITSITQLPLLNIRIGNVPIYNIVADYEIFEATANATMQIAPNNKEVMALNKLVRESKSRAMFMKQYGKGNNAPRFSFTTKSGISFSNEQLSKMPYVLYYDTDTTLQAQQRWDNISLARFANNKVVACVPQSFKIQKINVLVGLFDAETTKHFVQMQPVAIYVDANGKITDIKVNIKP